jgi:hypothetical protein
MLTNWETPAFAGMTDLGAGKSRATTKFLPCKGRISRALYAPCLASHSSSHLIVYAPS